MGSNISSQITKITTDSITEITTNLTTDNTTDIDNSQVVNIQDISGNVDINEINVSQHVQVNVKQSMEALSENTAKEKLSNSVLTASKQLASGLNLAQVGYSDQHIEGITKVVSDFTNAVSQVCAATAKQKQEVNIKGIKGSLKLNKLVLKQITGIASECVQSALLNNQSIKELESKFTQDNSQTLQGLDASAIAVMAIAAIGLPIVGGGVLIANIAPLFIILGVASLIYANIFKTETVEFKMFSGLYNLRPTSTFEITKDHDITNITEMFKRSSAQSFDLDRCKKTLSFYSENKPLTELATQDIAMIAKLVTDEKAARNGDLVYDGTTGALSVKCDGTLKQLKVMGKNKVPVYDPPNLTVDGTRVELKLPNLVNISGRKVGYVDGRFIIAGFMCMSVGLLILLLKRTKSKTV